MVVKAINKTTGAVVVAHPDDGRRSRGIDTEARESVMTEMQKPTDTDALVNAAAGRPGLGAHAICDHRIGAVEIKKIDFTQGSIRYQAMDTPRKQNFEEVNVKQTLRS